MKLDIQIDKKTIIVISGVAVALLVFFMFIIPLWSKVSDVTKEVRTLNDELSQVRHAIQMSKDLGSASHPLTRGEVSVAINEIMEAGTALDIEFFSTSPQQVRKNQDSKYPVLPIHMELQSTYENFGVFLGGLENLKKSILTVSQFDIERRPLILPKIYIDLVVDIHLAEGEGG